MRVGKYEVGRTLGEGNFAKVKVARDVGTGELFAIKIVSKHKLKLTHPNMIAQIKREISTMKLIRHPNVVRIYEVMASKTNIYIVLELVIGGELFDKIASHGRLMEDEARKYFQQLINAVDFCHSRGIFHRDLKPENLLLDGNGLIKVSDFGLSALPQQVREDGLLHTACGTPNYVAPEVIKKKGYDGSKADLWSCGVILFVLLAGYLPFDDSNLMSLYEKRMTVSEVIENEWFKKGYQPASSEAVDADIDNVKKQEEPALMNAFELISTSQGLNLGILFERQMGAKLETRFASKLPANELLSKIEAAAATLGFNTQKRNFKLKLHSEKYGRHGHLVIETEVFELAPLLYMVELRKFNGDALEFNNFYSNISTGLKDIIWKPSSDSICNQSTKNKID